VLLIDADMRCPVLHQRAGCKNEKGLRDVLSTNLPLSQAVVRLSNNLDILTAGSDPLNPIALLQSDEFAALLKGAQDDYELVILDSPALASVSDGLLVSARVDGTVLVVAADSTDESEAHRIVGQFAQLGINNVLGIVINKDTNRMRDYSDYFAQGARTDSLPGGA
jgi:capsular exopolysaccharide synthesis family protein